MRGFRLCWYLSFVGILLLSRAVVDTCGRCRRYTSDVQRHCHMEEAERSLKRGMSTLSARDRCGSGDMCVPQALGVGEILYHPAFIVYASVVKST